MYLIKNIYYYNLKIMKDKLDGLENWLNINIEICESVNKIDITF